MMIRKRLEGMMNDSQGIGSYPGGGGMGLVEDMRDLEKGILPQRAQAAASGTMVDGLRNSQNNRNMPDIFGSANVRPSDGNNDGVGSIVDGVRGGIGNAGGGNAGGSIRDQIGGANAGGGANSGGGANVGDRANVGGGANVGD